MPILTNYLIDVFENSNKIEITATDLDITAIVEIEAMVSEGGKATVSAKSFNEIIHSLPNSLITFEEEDSLLNISCDHSIFKILCSDYQQFPLVPEMNLTDAQEIDALLFGKMISYTHFAVSVEINRPVFTGIFWKITSERQLMVATDGKKIAEFTLDANTEIEEEKEKIIPTKGLLFLDKVINEENEKILVQIETNRIMFKYGPYKIFSHVIEGKYPDYTKAIPTDNQNLLICNKKILKESIRRVSLLASEDTLRIKFEINSELIKVSSSNKEMGGASDSIETFSYEGEPLTIAFNFRFLLSILNIIETEEVVIRMGGRNTPSLICNNNLEAPYKIRFLLMPLRIK